MGPRFRNRPKSPGELMTWKSGCSGSESVVKPRSNLRRAHPRSERLEFLVGYGRGYGQVGQSLASVAAVGYPKKEAPGGSSPWGFSYYLAATLLREPAS